MGGGGGLYLVWNRAAGNTNKDPHTRAVMSRGAYDIVGADGNRFDRDDYRAAAETHRVP